MVWTASNDDRALRGWCDSKMARVINKDREGETNERKETYTRHTSERACGNQCRHSERECTYLNSLTEDIMQSNPDSIIDGEDRL